MAQTVKIITITELRKHASKYLDFVNAGSKNKVYITYRGKTSVIMISADYYESMQKTIQTYTEKLKKV
jgi:prevent-host-death family protein